MSVYYGEQVRGYLQRCRHYSARDTLRELYLDGGPALGFSSVCILTPPPGNVQSCQLVGSGWIGGGEL